jgi:hypothetical protein
MLTRETAGDEVSVEMHAQPNDRSCASDAIGGNHFGPVMVYLSKVSDAETADGSDPFFKIGESGYDEASDTWGTDVLNENCGKFDVTLPADLAAGDYLLRAEAVALHAASQEGGAQFYVSCYVGSSRSSNFGAWLTRHSNCGCLGALRRCRKASSFQGHTRLQTPASRLISGAMGLTTTTSPVRLFSRDDCASKGISAGV